MNETTERKRRFNLFYKNLKESKDFEKLSVYELIWRGYNQACADCGQDCSEISIEETQKIVEDQMFFDFISDCLLHPNKSKPVQSNDYVKITYCEPDKCIGFPDRMEEMDCEHCEHTRIINLSKLCGVESDEKIDDKILTPDEVKELSKAIAKGNE